MTNETAPHENGVDAAVLSAITTETPTEPLPPAEPAPPSFADLGLHPDVKLALDDMGYFAPTPVQTAVYGPVSEGKDLMVQSRTGTGKTTAFGLPIISRLVPTHRQPQALILAPTRELALQVARELTQLGKHRGILVEPIYGGAPIGKQIKALRDGVHIIVGTPGRVLDHIGRRTLDCKTITTFVLDECDEMLSMGFLEDIERVVSHLPEKKQTLLFSATMPDEVTRYARRHMKAAEQLSLSRDSISVAEIHHAYYIVSGIARSRDLLKIIFAEEPESAIIFCNMRDETTAVAKFLQKQGLDAEPLSSDLSQADRERVMGRMKRHDLRFLCATDVAARGIDISNLSHVINFSVPESPEIYVHRTGRTGRAGKKGTALSLVGPRELGNFRYVRLQFGIKPEERVLPKDTIFEGKLKVPLPPVGTPQPPDPVQILIRGVTGTAGDIERQIFEKLYGTVNGKRVLAQLVAEKLDQLSTKSRPRRERAPRRDEEHAAAPAEGGEVREDRPRFEDRPRRDDDRPRRDGEDRPRRDRDERPRFGGDRDDRPRRFDRERDRDRGGRGFDRDRDRGGDRGERRHEHEVAAQDASAPVDVAVGETTTTTEGARDYRDRFRGGGDRDRGDRDRGRRFDRDRGDRPRRDDHAPAAASGEPAVMPEATGEHPVVAAAAAEASGEQRHEHRERHARDGEHRDRGERGDRDRYARDGGDRPARDGDRDRRDRGERGDRGERPARDGGRDRGERGDRPARDGGEHRERHARDTEVQPAVAVSAEVIPASNVATSFDETVVLPTVETQPAESHAKVDDVARAALERADRGDRKGKRDRKTAPTEETREFWETWAEEKSTRSDDAPADKPKHADKHKPARTDEAAPAEAAAAAPAEEAREERRGRERGGRDRGRGRDRDKRETKPDKGEKADKADKAVKAAPAPAAAADGGQARLFINLGKKHGVSADDLRKMLAGPIGGDTARIGSVSLRDSHAHVRVPEELVEAIIAGVHGTTHADHSVTVERARA